ncbi:MAG: hypothetical protein R3F34_04455 [Planctomycetota bacterium]
MLEGALEHHDFVLLVCPPVLEDSTAMAFPGVVDQVVLLAVDGRTRVDELDETRDLLTECKARRIGIVLAKPSPWRALRRLLWW